MQYALEEQCFVLLKRKDITSSRNPIFDDQVVVRYTPGPFQSHIWTVSDDLAP